MELNSDVSSDHDSGVQHKHHMNDNHELIDDSSSSHHGAAEMVLNSQYILERAEAGGYKVTTATGQLVTADMLQDPNIILLHAADLKDGTQAYYTTADGDPHSAIHTTDTIITEGRYVQYEGGQLTTAEITEHDRSIAESLLAVQYPSKNIGGTNVIMTAESIQDLITSTTTIAQPTLTDMVVNYIEHVEEAPQQQQQTITANSTPTGTIIDHHTRKQLRIVSYPNPPHIDARTIDANELANAMQTTEIHQAPPQQTIKKVNQHQLSPRGKYKQLQQQQQQQQLEAIKDENEDDPDYDTEEDLDDSDFDIESETRSTRSRNLPHKKRITRKLKNPNTGNRHQQQKKFKCGKCSDQFTSVVDFQEHVKYAHTVVTKASSTATTKPSTATKAKEIFTCQICNKLIYDQLKFFEHLKSHYEPGKEELTAEEQEEIKEASQVTLIEMDNREEPEQQHPSVIVTEMPPALPPPLNCPNCSKVFRRQKALTKHMSTCQIVLAEEAMDTSMGEEYIDAEEAALKKGEWYQNQGKSTTHHELTNVPPIAPTKVIMEDSGQGESFKYIVSHECSHCGLRFTESEDLETHLEKEHNIDMNGMPVSPSSTTTRRTRNSNKKKANETVVAYNIVTRPEAIEEEAATTSQDEKNLVRAKQMHLTCPTCGRAFNHRNSLVYHLRSHTGERPHQCDMCGKSFYAGSALKVHMRLHSGDKPYKCEICGRHFRQWGDLKYHCISIHTDEKQYQCEFCGKDFARKYSLIVHRRIHTGEKNYKCEFCNKTFRASSYLQNHRRIHTGEKPHPCEICGKPFRVRSDMKRHMQTHNRDNSGNQHGAAAAANNAVSVHTAAMSHSSQSSSQGANETQNSDILDNPVAAEITVVDTERVDTPSASNSNLGQDQDNDASQQVTEQITADEEVVETFIQYPRDPLETVTRDSSNVYIWPIYMS